MSAIILQFPTFGREHRWPGDFTLTDLFYIVTALRATAEIDAARRDDLLKAAARLETYGDLVNVYLPLGDPA